MKVVLMALNGRKEIETERDITLKKFIKMLRDEGIEVPKGYSVLVNGERASSSQKLKEGDIVTFAPDVKGA